MNVSLACAWTWYSVQLFPNLYSIREFERTVFCGSINHLKSSRRFPFIHFFSHKWTLILDPKGSLLLSHSVQLKIQIGSCQNSEQLKLLCKVIQTHCSNNPVVIVIQRWIEILHSFAGCTNSSDLSPPEALREATCDRLLIWTSVPLFLRSGPLQ